MKYTITYEDGEEISQNDGIKAGHETTLKFKVEFLTETLTEDVLATISESPIAGSYTLEFEQGDNTADYTHATDTIEG